MPPVPALFLHIQKTAGTSILDMVRAHYGVRHVISHGDYTTLSREECDRKDFISGHFGFEYAEPFMDGRYCFTFLRNPIERILSLYNFCLSRPAEEFPIYRLAQTKSLEEFLLSVQEIPLDSDTREKRREILSYRETVWNNQAWQLSYGWGRDGNKPLIIHFTAEDIVQTACANLQRFDYIGITEDFDRDCAIIAERLGIHMPRNLHKANQSKKRISLRDVPVSTRKLLEECTVLDREVYNAALSLRGNARI